MDSLTIKHVEFKENPSKMTVADFLSVDMVGNIKDDKCLVYDENGNRIMGVSDQTVSGNNRVRLIVEYYETTSTLLYSTRDTLTVYWLPEVLLIGKRKYVRVTS